MEHREGGHQGQPEEVFYGLNKEKDKLERAGVRPTAEVLAENLEVSVTDVEEMERRLYHGDVSLDEPLYEGGEDVMNTIGSDEDIEETVAAKEEDELLRHRLTQFKKLLSEKERFILEHRIMAEDPLPEADRGALQHVEGEQSGSCR